MESAEGWRGAPSSRASGPPLRADPQPQVPESWLRGEHLTASERLERLAGDRELMTHLRRLGFEGPEYEYFATELSKYGMAVIGGWIRRGLIFEKCSSRGFGGLEPPPPGTLTDRDNVDELAGETVAVALGHFRTSVLIPGRWDPAKGASLKTFFIGQCLMRFPNIYRHWLGDLRRNSALPADEEDIASLAIDHIGSPEDDVITAMAANEALAHVHNPQVRQALVMNSVGYKHREIATKLGVTEKTVERMLANERSRARKRGAG